MPKSAELTHYPGRHHEGWPDGLKNLFIDFYKKVLDRQHKGSFAAITDGHHIMQLIEAVMKSHLEKRWVRLDQEARTEVTAG